MLNRYYHLMPRLAEAAQQAFVWQEHSREVVITALLSMVPLYEGRYAVLSAKAMGMPAVFTYLLALICSSIPVPFILLLLRPVLNWIYTWPIKPVRKFAAWVERRAERKHAKMKEQNRTGLRAHFSENTADLIGLYIFVALPLPGTGVWTGSAIASLFHMPRLKAGLTILVGNATACLITTVAPNLLSDIWHFITGLF